jgi:hypothetical protein
MPIQTVALDNEYVVQYASSVVSILRVEDEPEIQKLSVVVQLGNKPQYRYTIEVLTGEAYTPEWTNETITNSIKNYFTVTG